MEHAGCSADTRRNSGLRSVCRLDRVDCHVSSGASSRTDACAVGSTPGRIIEFLASVAVACRQLCGDFTGLARLADCRFCSDRVRDHPAHVRSPQQYGCGDNALVGLEIPGGTASGPGRADCCGADGTGAVA